MQAEPSAGPMGLMNAPFHINWNYTRICNFNCTHCYSRLDSACDSDELDAAGRRQVAQNIISSGAFSVNLGGGEPLLVPGLMGDIACMAQSHVHVMLSSNGWQASRARAAELRAAGLGAIILSLDNSDPERHDRFRRQPGSFEQVLAAADLYREAGLPVSFSTIITSENFDALETIITLAVAHGGAAVEFKRLRIKGNAREQTSLLLSSAQEALLYERMGQWKQRYPLQLGLVYGVQPVAGIDAGCPCGKTSLAIRENGDIAPCVYNPRSIGNATRDDIGTLWREAPQLVYMRSHYSCHGLEED